MPFQTRVPSDVFRALNAAEQARVLSILRAHRRPTIEQLPAKARMIAEAIVSDARVRRIAPPGSPE
jgi:hypothetical protein